MSPYDTETRPKTKSKNSLSLTEPPNSRESEMMVLGCMLTSNNSLSVAANSLDDTDFYYTEHKTIFHILKNAYKNDKPADVLLISEELKRQDKLASIGGVAYLADLAQFAGTSAYIEEYVDLIKNKSLLREVIQISRTVENDALDEPQDTEKLLEILQTRIQRLQEKKNRGAYNYLLEPTSEKEISDELKNTSPGIHVGYTIGDIDLKIPGGAISILAAPTSHGKTATLINFALGALAYQDQQDKSVCFFSYEESKASIISLFLNTYINETLSKNNRDSIKSYFRDEPQYINQAIYAEFMRKKNNFFKELIDHKRLHIHYTNFTARELVAAIRFLKENTNVGLICIDYMQLLTMSSGKFSSRQEELKQVCLMLKDCAVETGLPILLGAQFNRHVLCEADLSPTNIGEAGDIERIASLIIGFWNRNFEGFSKDGNIGRDKKPVPKESALYMTILKGRETGAGAASVLGFNGNTGKLSHQEKKKPSPEAPSTKTKISTPYKDGIEELYE